MHKPAIRKIRLLPFVTVFTFLGIFSTSSAIPLVYNLKLSQARADSVRTHLTEIEGIDSSLLDAIGFGEGRPLAPNTTPGGKAQNRRVEFHIER